MPNKSLKTEKFSTSDLGCATALVSLGAELLNLNRRDPKRVLFVFKQNNRIDSWTRDYWNGSLKVGARAMFDNLKMLKTQIYNKI